MDEAGEPTVFGADYSVYVRAVRLALEEKGVGYELVEIDIFAPGGPPEDYLRRHPFRRIPAFTHGDFALYETPAIQRYVDEAFDGPPVQPVDPRSRARMTQLIAILDNYGYRPLVWDIYVERVVRPGQGRAADEDRIQGALPAASRCLHAMAALMGDAPWLAGAEPSLADLHAAPMFDYFLQAPESHALMAPHANLRAWWERLRARPAMARTAPRN
jgi:glutathione S-transferase